MYWSAGLAIFFSSISIDTYLVCSLSSKLGLNKLAVGFDISAHLVVCLLNGFAIFAFVIRMPVALPFRHVWILCLDPDIGLCRAFR